MDVARLAAIVATPVLAVCFAAYQCSPRMRLLRLCGSSAWNAAVAVRAKQLLLQTEALAPVPLANDASQLDTEECARRLLGSRHDPQSRAAQNLRQLLAFVAELHALHAEIRRQKQPFDPDDAAQLALLRRLWEVFHPEETFCARSPAYLRLGFQGHDPASDFRGMGCLALRELVHFSEAFPKEAMQLADGWECENGEPRSLPLALTAINATAWLWTLLLDGHLDCCFFMHGATLRTYRDLYCELVRGFVRTWTSEAPESIAEFERIQTWYLTEVRGRLGGAQRNRKLVQAVLDVFEKLA